MTPLGNPVIVVGAGIAGVACARALVDAGLRVDVLDRGRRIGGRMASRTVDRRPVDFGASYFTVSDPAFEAVVEDWRHRDLARPWTDTFAVLGDGDPDTTSGPMRWAAPRGLRSLVEDLARGLNVTSSRTVAKATLNRELEVDGAPAPAVVLAMPDPQARRLLSDTLGSEWEALDREFEPVLALTATFESRAWDLDGAFVNDDPCLAWLADDGRRRGDGAPVLVAHSVPEFAAQHLVDPDGATDTMVDAVRRTLDLPEPVNAAVHRWSFARPEAGRDTLYLLSDHNFGVCGDAWTDKPRVEGAYLSGRALGEALAERLS